MAGESNWSESVTVNTLVDLMNIPRAESLIFEKSTNTAHVQTPTTELLLVAELEIQTDDGGWKKYADHKMSRSSYGAMNVDVATQSIGYNQLPVTELRSVLKSVLTY